MTFPVIGLLGQAGCGKDLVADFFVEKGFAKVSFSDPMKRFIQRLFDFDEVDLWGSSESRNQTLHLGENDWDYVSGQLEDRGREFVGSLDLGGTVQPLLELWNWFHMLYTNYHDSVSARIILQTLGTEWGRKQHPLLWIHYLYDSIYPALLSGKRYDPKVGAFGAIEPLHAGIIVPDHRFANEVMATREAGGHMIRIHRPLRPAEMVDPGVKNHASEKEQETMASDFFHRELMLPEGLDRVNTVLEDLWFKHPWSVS